VPRHLVVQTARVVYSGLLRSCGFANENGALSDIGERIADEFGNGMPRSKPKRVSGCVDIPCLSKIRRREALLLRRGLIEMEGAAENRQRTRREIGIRILQAARRNGAAWLLAKYLLKPRKRSSEPERLLHAAARLELRSMPLTRLFLYFYQHKGRIGVKIPKESSFRPYRVRNSPVELLADVAAHLRKANRLGDPSLPLEVLALRREVLRLHHAAKPEAPWVDEDWRVLRPGLQPQQLPSVHEFRLTAFASLLHDLELR
jgi:hypothetical protein